MRGTVPAPDLPPGRRSALVIAIAEYQDPGLGPLQAPGRDVARLASVLGDPQVGGFAVTEVLDQGKGHLERALARFLAGRDPGELVMVYLSCHGVLDARGRLFFAATDTELDVLPATGVESSWLVEQLEECRARRQVVILDCCYSGAFARGSKGVMDLERTLTAPAPGRGRVVLTASRDGERSFEAERLGGEQGVNSVFTAGLVEGLATGAADQDGDGLVSVEDAYNYATAYVRENGAAQSPQRWVHSGEGPIILARSPVGAVVTPARLPEHVRVSLDSPHPQVRIGAVHVLGELLSGPDPAMPLTAWQTLERISEHEAPSVAAASRHYLREGGHDGTADPAEGSSPVATPSRAATHTAGGDSTDSQPVKSLAAPALAPVLGLERGGDPPAAEASSAKAQVFELLADAERVSRTITSSQQQSRSLRGVAEALAGHDQDKARKLLADAEESARSIAKSSAQVTEMSAVAAAMADLDPGRSRALIADAGLQAATIAKLYERTNALDQIVQTIAQVNPAEAERIARTIAEPIKQGVALRRVVRTLAGQDLGKAEGVARSIADFSVQCSALLDIAGAAAGRDPVYSRNLLADAEHLARNITGGSAQDHLLMAIAVMLADQDPAEAERVACAISYLQVRCWALCKVAQALFEQDPGRARRLLVTEAWQCVQGTSHLTVRASEAANIARTLAIFDPQSSEPYAAEAERLARTITWEPEHRAGALGDVAGILAAHYPQRSRAMFAEAEHVTYLIADRETRAAVLERMVQAMTELDPLNAERLARTITEPYKRASALCHALQALARQDPIKTEHLARTITEPDDQARVQHSIVAALAERNPVEAERFARTITDPDGQASEMQQVVRALAKQNPGEAERLARSITVPEYEARALMAIARVLEDQKD